jgi:glutaconate CoA-transferase subunit A
MAHAARQALVTVEEIVDGSLLEREEVAAGVLPAMYVGGVALAPRGAWPLGCQDLYDADDAELLRYAAAARSEDGFRDWLRSFLARPAQAA